MGVEEDGFTLPELLTVLAIMGVLIAIAIMVLLALLERWRVDAAAHQLAADLRLAHARSVNQLTDWRVVLVPGMRGEEEGPDYYLVRLKTPYDDGGPVPVLDGESVLRRTFPADVMVMDQQSPSGRAIRDDAAMSWCATMPGRLCSGVTRTLEFNSDGTMVAFVGPSGTIRVTVDGDPQRKLTFLSATSRIKLWPW
ncbi:pilus assembly FimT family protein [Rubrobacter calidifluminis]|uniref:pilus assembly FimT family protein n=1 Tax=Rubrobacter calidifluminis TaxID=1392640 RepID=UPI0023606759|nr:prepilin-type N-terminal cleavage/methylation domain-containing protein [Rubrobacter calidifluminis]